MRNRTNSKRWRITGWALKISVIALLAVGLLVPTDTWRVERDGDRLTFGVLRPRDTIERRVLFEDDFVRLEQSWLDGEAPGAGVDVRDGRLRLRLAPGIATMKGRGFEEQGGVTVAAEIVASEEHRGGVAGVWCGESAGPDEPDIGIAGGYVVMLQPEVGRLAVARYEGTIDRGLTEATQLATGESEPGPRLLLELSCRGGSAGEREISVRAGGREVASAVHGVDRARYDAAGLVGYNPGDVPAELGFDNFVVQAVDGRR